MCYPSFMVVKYLQTLVREEYSLYPVTIYVLFYKVAIEINHACFLFSYYARFVWTKLAWEGCVLMCQARNPHFL